MKMLVIAILVSASGAQLATASGPAGKPTEQLVRGGAFIDRFLPVPLQGELVSEVWGGENVVPRDVKNGIEDPEYSYWGGRMITGDDGKEHLFVCRWLENISKKDKSGHHLWWASTVVHAVSESPLGPFEFVEEIGKGHNPEIYRRADGSYVIGVMGEKAYEAQSLNGPWSMMEVGFEFLGEPLNKTNRTYVVREDGSVLMMNKNGFIFTSAGADEQFKQVTEKSAYSGIRATHLEDPVIWKDEVQYHLVVNDWKEREAYYLRSPDGIDWKLDPGRAFDPGIMKHVGGTSEKWYKFERPKVRQDRYGRATHMNFAVIDSTKDEDVANDDHSSKNVVIPLTVPRRLEVLNRDVIGTGTRVIRVKILAEEGFDPQKDVDVNSLFFGAPDAIDFGKGYRATSSKVSGSDLVVIFNDGIHGISTADFAGKMIGKDSSGELLFGYSKLPE